MTPLDQRFWSKVDKRGPMHPTLKSRCWEWTGSIRLGRGYGQFWHDGGPKSVHRLSWIEANGESTSSLWVLHHCDNRKCVRPEHLYLGTAKNNYDDMVSRNRGGQGGPGWPLGIKHPRAKLSADDVRAIKESSESTSKLASRYGVGFKHIWNIRNGNRRTA